MKGKLILISAILISFLFICFTSSAQNQIRKKRRSNIPDKVTAKLFMACEKGDLELVKQCIKDGADINYQILIDMPARHGMDFNGWNALTFAILKSHIDIAEFLIDEGIAVNAEIGNFGSNLNFAMEGFVNDRKSFYPVERRPVSFVKLLIEKGADVNIPTREGSSPLILAASVGSKELVLLLLEKGADIEATDAENLTALDRALENKHTEIAEILKSWKSKE